jgi:hypothetical protein
MITEEQREKLREVTVGALLAIRSEYLKTPGCSVLKHWDQMSDRMRAAARTSAGPEEWVTAMLRSLQISAAGKYSSRSLDRLVETARPMRADWLRLVEAEFGYLVAKARLDAETRRERREASKAEAGDPDAWDHWAAQNTGGAAVEEG